MSKRKRLDTNDSTPVFNYIQYGDGGIGELYIDGIRVKGLISIEIKAETKSDEPTFPTITIEIAPTVTARGFRKQMGRK